MYAKGMTTRQISETIEDIYGFEVSEGMVSGITDKLLPRIEEWQNRPLSPVYPIVFIDAVHFSVRDDGVIRKLAAYKDADFVVIAAPTNYDSKKNFFDTSAVEAVIKLVIEYNPDVIMVIK